MLPIVFLHAGFSPYLAFTLGQARMRNLRNPVILLGDASNNLLPYVRHVPFRHFASGAAKFQRVYQHLSANNPSYECFCFMRWFMLRDFMHAMKMRQCFHLDSDVLLFASVDEESPRWGQYDLTLVNGVCAGNMFVHRREALDELCELITRMFSDPDELEALRATYRRQSESGPAAISDMNALRRLYDAHRDRIGEMAGVRDGSTWCANVHLDEGFAMRPQGIKAVEFRGGDPYGRHVASGRDVLFKGLHFQGVGKKHIEPHFRAAEASKAAASAVPPAAAA